MGFKASGSRRKLVKFNGYLIDVDGTSGMRVNAEMKRFSKRAFVLLIVGILIQLASLFGEHATEIPVALRIIAPKYYHSMRGINELRETFKLEESDDGFSEISEILREYFLKVMKSQGVVVPKEVANSLIIENITLSGSGGQLANEPLPIGPVVSFKITCAKYPIPLPKSFNAPRWSDFNETVERLKIPNILVFCFVLFAIGSILDVLAFFIESAEPDKPILQGTDHREGPKPESPTERQ